LDKDEWFQLSPIAGILKICKNKFGKFKYGYYLCIEINNKVMAKKLKLWNGRGHGKYTRGHISVAAYSQKQAAELISIACYGPEYPNNIRVNEIREYYSDCWGNVMSNIEPTEPCVYIKEEAFSDKPYIKII
jgi:hypothetical protein